MTNLKDIIKGDTYTFSIELFQDEAETEAVDISDYTFTMLAKNASGTTAFSFDNTGFVQTTDFKRTITLSKTATAALTAGELSYQIDVTYPDTTAEEWARGFINVLP